MELSAFVDGIAVDDSVAIVSVVVCGIDCDDEGQEDKRSVDEIIVLKNESEA
jgi:hypothetical protein